MRILQLRSLVLFIFLLFSLCTCKEREKTKQTIICKFSNVEADNQSKTDEKEVDRMVKLIIDYTGLPMNFQSKETKQGNAAAYILRDHGRSHRYIEYNPSFFLQLNDKAGHQWASICILAHEIGHHLAGHTEKTSNKVQFELEADHFAGFILNRMGATLDQSMNAVEYTIPEHRSLFSPGKKKRLQAVTDGWVKAERSKNITLLIPGKYPEVTIRNLRDEDLADQSKWELSIMRSEVYARHGYKFMNDTALHNYFNMLGWYHVIPPSELSAEEIWDKMSKVEQMNLAKIQSKLNELQ